MNLVEKSEILVKKLIGKNITLSVAESLTGGMICSSICSVSGASKVFLEGIICYNENSKIKRLGVDEEDIKKFTTVSEQVAKQMAEGVRKCLKSNIGIATTGVAGPDDFDIYGNPKGLFYIAISSKKETKVFKFKEKGDREDIRNVASLFAIEKCLEVIG